MQMKLMVKKKMLMLVEENRHVGCSCVLTIFCGLIRLTRSMPFSWEFTLKNTEVSRINGQLVLSRATIVGMG